MDKYPCIKCGLCCHKIRDVVQGLKIEFPYGWDETGRCEKLGADNLCMVYDNRPMICNIDSISAGLNVDKKEFYNLNIASCNQLLQEARKKERIDFIP